MARRQSGTLTEVELEFMQVLWKDGEAAPEDVQKALLDSGRSLTGGSIRKMLSILVRKGYVSRKKQGKKYVYSPNILEEQAKTSMIRELVNRAFGGSASLMVATLIESGGDIPADDLRKIERIIAERKKEEGK
ncbi:BlaI/MecI/CopY family transcriptional regulator [Candidatus Latescibacterota bacterium]